MLRLQQLLLLLLLLLLQKVLQLLMVQIRSPPLHLVDLFELSHPLLELANLIRLTLHVAWHALGQREQLHGWAHQTVA